MGGLFHASDPNVLSDLVIAIPLYLNDWIAAIPSPLSKIRRLKRTCGDRPFAPYKNQNLRITLCK